MTQELQMKSQRIRHIKPEFFRHEGLFDLEQSTNLPIRLAWAGLWTWCDKHGRFEWKPRTLKLGILPYDAVDFGKILEALEGAGFIVKYKAEGGVYGYIPTWKKHQYIGKSERKTKFCFPAPEGVVDEPDSDETSEELLPNGTETVSEPLEPRRGKGMGMEMEKESVMENVNGAATLLQSQSHSSPDILFSNHNPNPQSQTKTQEPLRLTQKGAAQLLSPAPNGNGRPKVMKPRALAQLLFESLPEEIQKEAPDNWPKLWTTDMEKLCYERKFPSMEVADILLFALNSRFAKYITHAAPFVKMYDSIKEGYQKAAKKPAVLEKIIPSHIPWGYIIDAAERGAMMESIDEGDEL